MKKENKNKKGFTLLEMLVVVLIIGILAGIALPQYQMAVAKAKVASILPLMRRWKDALYEYKLQHGDYNIYDGAVLGANWPNDWKKYGNNPPCGDCNHCSNDYWNECIANEETTGHVFCYHEIDSNNSFRIMMYQHDDTYYIQLRGLMTCSANGTKGEKICKALGGKLLNGVHSYNTEEVVYQIN